MIKLSSQDYYLEGVTMDFFWKELDDITVGQRMDPEFGYTTPHFGKFENVFGGRRLANRFSIYLYRPVTQMVRTEILSKGLVIDQGTGLLIKCKFEYPFWSLLMLIIFGIASLSPFYQGSTAAGLIATFVGLLIYAVISRYNHTNIKSELAKQLRLIEEKARNI